MRASCSPPVSADHLPRSSEYLAKDHVTAGLERRRLGRRVDQRHRAGAQRRSERRVAHAVVELEVVAPIAARRTLVHVDQVQPVRSAHVVEQVVIPVDQQRVAGRLEHDDEIGLRAARVQALLGVAAQLEKPQLLRLGDRLPAAPAGRAIVEERRAEPDERPGLLAALVERAAAGVPLPIEPAEEAPHARRQLGEARPDARRRGAPDVEAHGEMVIGRTPEGRRAVQRAQRIEDLERAAVGRAPIGAFAARRRPRVGRVEARQAGDERVQRDGDVCALRKQVRHDR